MKKGLKERIYLDFASTTPCAREVFEAMLPFYDGSFANPASLYAEGVAAKKAVAAARKTCADILFAHSDEIIFTGSGTESNNLAILGTHAKALENATKKPHYITGAFEHASVLEVFRELEHKGATVTYILPTPEGLIDPREIKKSLKPNTVLVSIMYANNEIGTIQPIKEIAKVIRHHRKNNPKSSVVFHIDASQAANYLNLNVEQLGVDMITLDASKIYGPKGVGLLYKKRRVDLKPIMFGGGQEQGLRSGTENVAGIVGLSTALALVQNDKEKETKRLSAMRDSTIQEILKTYPGSSLNGHQTERLPNNINICFPNLDAEFAVLQLDARGIQCSSVTSCKNLSFDSSSYVIEALGKENCAKSSLRISLGRNTDKKEMKLFLIALKEIML